MKICILTHTFPRFTDDYSAPFMDGVARGMAEAQNEVFVLTPFTPGLEIQRPNRKYKLVTYKYIFIDNWHTLGYSKTLVNDMQLKPVVYLLAPLMFMMACISLYRLVKKEKIDIINAHWILPNGFIAAVISILTGVPVVSTLPGSDVYIARKNFIFRWAARFAGHYSSAITSNSQQLLEDLKQLGVKNSMTETIIYGVDPTQFKPDASQTKQLKDYYNIAAGKVVVLAVGRLVAKKGFVYLIKAAAKIVKENNNVIFMIIGEGDQRQELEALIQKEQLDQYFRLPGWVDYKQLVHVYNLADVFILPSIRDDKGNLDDQSVAVVEAMACAKPVITSNLPGYQIVVYDNQNGYLVKERDVEGISSAIRKLVSSPSLQKKFSSKSRELIVKHFSHNAVGQQYTKLFAKILDLNVAKRSRV